MEQINVDDAIEASEALLSLSKIGYSPIKTRNIKIKYNKMDVDSDEDDDENYVSDQNDSDWDS